MALSVKVREYRNYFFLVLILTSVSSSYAQTLVTRNWDQWNAISLPTYPGQTWSKYRTPEEAGWSSAKLAEARNTSESAGSGVVMAIVTVRQIDNQLEVECSRYGRFFLKPMSQSEFSTEDSEWRLSFTMGDAGQRYEHVFG
jgi:hypothetical protein